MRRVCRDFSWSLRRARERAGRRVVRIGARDSISNLVWRRALTFLDEVYDLVLYLVEYKTWVRLFFYLFL